MADPLIHWPTGTVGAEETDASATGPLRRRRTGHRSRLRPRLVRHPVVGRAPRRRGSGRGDGPGQHPRPGPDGAAGPSPDGAAGPVGDLAAMRRLVSSTRHLTRYAPRGGGADQDTAAARPDPAPRNS
ncbi:hypothetical protein ACFV14_13735 [Streptomyces zaomyceticus]|uniref:hypothetical protein n=1 Tax=Streptomyces zaomyceticus TaxID=68286 RepID=UPI0036B712CD